jgi:putative autotransporter adhesin-like protein
MKPYALLVLAGCNLAGFTGVTGSGTAKSEVRPATGATEVAVSGALSVDIGPGPEAKVEISGDDNLVPLVTTEVKGSRLEIGSKKSMRTKVPMVIRVSLPTLVGASASGASTAVIHDAKADSLKLVAEGASKLRADGAVGQLTLEASGASDADLDQLAAERARATLSGASEAEVAVSKSLDAHLGGASTLKYRGDPPELKQDVNGVSSLVKR